MKRGGISGPNVIVFFPGLNLPSSEAPDPEMRSSIPLRCVALAFSQNQVAGQQQDQEEVYSGDLKSGLVWISNGQKEVELQMVWILNGI